ncbi:MAG TPA: response regulator [Rhizomicrobium sp.]|nr:response regulator [Rhizomicrobium sp.]
MAEISGAPRGTVLVVEDVALIRITIVDMVEQIGFAAVQAADAAQALAILEQEQVDILLTDLGLPGMSGRQLMEEALKRNPALKVIVASGYSTPEGASPSGTVAYLAKPFDLQKLRQVLQEQLGS